MLCMFVKMIELRCYSRLSLNSYNVLKNFLGINGCFIYLVLDLERELCD